MLLEGGDTDTNACIVGGMIGAAIGKSNIPEKLWMPIMECTTKGGAHKRDRFLIPKDAGLLNLVEKIYNNAEETIAVIDGISKVYKAEEKKAMYKGKEIKKFYK